MKKLILVFAAACSLTACKKIAAGGNEGRLKLEEGSTRYSDDKQGTIIPRDTAAVAATPAKATDSSAIKAVENQGNATRDTKPNSMSAPVNNATTETK